MGKTPRGHQAKLHDKRLDSLSSEHIEMREAQRRLTNGTGEAEVVLTEQLAVYVNRFKEKWNAERNPRTTPYDDYQVMGAFDWLSQETGINVRRIWGISKLETKTTGLGTADSLMSAMGIPMSMTDMHVLPNPNWSLEKWVEHQRERGCI
jgi:hypothetical protein